MTHPKKLQRETVLRLVPVEDRVPEVGEVWEIQTGEKRTCVAIRRAIGSEYAWVLLTGESAGWGYTDDAKRLRYLGRLEQKEI